LPKVAVEVDQNLQQMVVNLLVGMVDLVEVVVLMYLFLLEVWLDMKERQQVQDHLLRFKDIQVVHMVLD
tara:strand:- start:290 stop:496 length:207 start_codon:yes stop_codon:yes gene_type:complete